MLAARDSAECAWDVGKPHVNIGDPVRVGGGLGFGQKRLALLVGFQHDLDQRLLGAGGFLRHLADAGHSSGSTPNRSRLPCRR